MREAGDTVRELAAGFCRRHGISRIRLTPMDGVTAAHRVCNLEFEFSDNDQRYRANFKLQGQDAAIGDLVSSIDSSGDVALIGETAGSAVDALEAFFRRIEKRIRKVRQEQSVQSVTFLGNSFLLHGTTRFTVTDDDGGRLTIEIHKGGERQKAHLIASSLLDGLYDGSIQLLGPESPRS